MVDRHQRRDGEKISLSVAVERLLFKRLAYFLLIRGKLQFLLRKG